MLTGIETLADATPIGVIALTDAEPENGRAELDVYVGEAAYRGQGYGTDAIRVICRYGFDQMRLHGISLWVVPENEAAVHVYKKLGFVEEGRERERFRRDGAAAECVMQGSGTPARAARELALLAIDAGRE